MSALRDAGDLRLVVFKLSVSRGGKERLLFLRHLEVVVSPWHLVVGLDTVPDGLHLSERVVFLEVN